MRRIYIIIMLLSANLVYAQGKIEGLGKFKIGQTTIAITDDIATESGDKINIMDEYLNMSMDQFRIGEVVINKTKPERSSEEASFCPGVRVFQITNYKIAEITVNNIFLIFKDEVLISLKCDNSTRLDEALLLKYGKPVLKVDKKKVQCLYKMTGNKIELEEATYRQNWQNGNILATLFTSKFLNANCQEQLTNYFIIRNPIALAIVTECDKTIRLKMTEKKQAEKKKSLSDL